VGVHVVARDAESAGDLSGVDQALADRALDAELAAQALDLLVGEVEPHVADLHDHAARPFP